MKFSEFNFFRKVPEHLQSGSIFGMLVSTISFLVMVSCVVYEFKAYNTNSTTSLVVLDSHQEDMFRINFNITLLSVPCSYASVDLSDDMGVKFMNITHNIRRWRTSTTDGDSGLVIKPLEEVTSNFQQEMEYSHEVHPGEEFAPLLDESSFEDFMKKYEMVVVNYFAPWCPWCKKLEPVWEYVAAQMLDHPEFSETVKLAKVDCTDPNSIRLCKRARIHAFPSILIYFGGNVWTRYMYNGPRTSSAIMLFLEVFYKRVENYQLSQLSVKDEEAKLDKELDYSMERVVNRDQREEFKQNVFQSEIHLDAREGCQLVGSLSVNRVPGKLQFRPFSNAHSFSEGDNLTESSAMDVSHRVNSLTFGQITGMKQRLVNFLRVFGHDRAEKLIFSSLKEQNEDTFKSQWTEMTDKMENTTHKSRTVDSTNRSITIEHYIQVIGIDVLPPSKSPHPHNFLRFYEYTASSNQYETRSDARNGNETDQSPSAIFSYDISPLVIQRKIKKVPFYRFLVSLCAIVGGAYTVFSMIHSSVWCAMNSLQKKQALNKLS